MMMLHLTFTSLRPRFSHRHRSRRKKIFLSHTHTRASSNAARFTLPFRELNLMIGRNDPFGENINDTGRRRGFEV